MSCALGEACGARPALTDAAGVGTISGRGPWTKAAYAQANEDALRQTAKSGVNLDRGGVPLAVADWPEAAGNTPLGPLTQKSADKNQSPYGSALTLALTATGGLLLFGGLGGKMLEEKFPGIQRNMTVGALALGGVVGLGVVGAVVVVPAFNALVATTPEAASAAAASGTLATAPAGAAVSTAVQTELVARAVAKTVLIGGALYALEQSAPRISRRRERFGRPFTGRLGRKSARRTTNRMINLIERFRRRSSRLSRRIRASRRKARGGSGACASPGNDKGAWGRKTPDGKGSESLHPDPNHGPPDGPHWDYIDQWGSTIQDFS